MIFSKLIFFHKPVAKGVHYLLFSLWVWVLYPKELSLLQDWPHLNSVNLNPLSAHRLLANILNCVLDPFYSPGKEKTNKNGGFHSMQNCF